MEFHTPSGVIHHDIDYDWRLKYCVDCAKFGHTPNECWQKKKAQEEKEDFVEYPKKKRRAGRRRKVVSKWVAKSILKL